MEIAKILGLSIVILLIILMFYLYTSNIIEEAIVKAKRRKDSEIKKYETLNKELKEKIEKAEECEYEALKKLNSAEKLKEYYENCMKDYENKCKELNSLINARANKQFYEYKNKYDNIVLSKERKIAEKEAVIQDALNRANEEATKIITNAQADAESIKKESQIATKNLEAAKKQRVVYCDEAKKQLNKQCNFDLMYKKIIDGKLNNAFKTDLSIDRLYPIKANVRSGDHLYTNVTLSSCSCKDFEFGHGDPCKHMLFLAYNLGILQIAREEQEKAFKKIMSQVNKNKSVKNSKHKEI